MNINQLQKEFKYANIKKYKKNSQKIYVHWNLNKLLIVKYKKAGNGNNRYVYKGMAKFIWNKKKN